MPAIKLKDKLSNNLDVQIPVASLSMNKGLDRPIFSTMHRAQYSYGGGRESAMRSVSRNNSVSALSSHEIEYNEYSVLSSIQQQP